MTDGRIILSPPATGAWEALAAALDEWHGPRYVRRAAVVPAAPSSGNYAWVYVPAGDPITLLRVTRLLEENQ